MWGGGAEGRDGVELFTSVIRHVNIHGNLSGAASFALLFNSLQSFTVKKSPPHRTRIIFASVSLFRGEKETWERGVCVNR